MSEERVQVPAQVIRRDFVISLAGVGALAGAGMVMAVCRPDVDVGVPAAAIAAAWAAAAAAVAVSGRYVSILERRSHSGAEPAVRLIPASGAGAPRRESARLAPDAGGLGFIATTGRLARPKI